MVWQASIQDVDCLEAHGAETSLVLSLPQGKG